MGSTVRFATLANILRQYTERKSVVALRGTADVHSVRDWAQAAGRTTLT